MCKNAHEVSLGYAAIPTPIPPQPDPTPLPCFGCCQYNSCTMVLYRWRKTGSTKKLRILTLRAVLLRSIWRITTKCSRRRWCVLLWFAFGGGVSPRARGMGTGTTHAKQSAKGPQTAHLVPQVCEATAMPDLWAPLTQRIATAVVRSLSQCLGTLLTRPAAVQKTGMSGAVTRALTNAAVGSCHRNICHPLLDHSPAGLSVHLSVCLSAPQMCWPGRGGMWHRGSLP